MTQLRRVLATLDLAKKTELGVNVIAVECFWQDDACVAQVEGVCVLPDVRMPKQKMIENSLFLMVTN